MSLKYCLLGLINYGGMTGYELDKAFKDSLYPICNATTSQIYRELSDMKKSAWLTSNEVFQKGKPNKIVYEITEIGKKELKAWLMEDHISAEMRIKHPFFMQMFFAGENSIEENIQILEHMRMVIADETQKANHRKNKVGEYISKVNNKNKSLYWELLSEFSFRYYEQLMLWAEQSIEKLKTLQKEE